ncbi:hypothetical protein GCM10010116_13580 [Microbispora rosea subsp. aerata]|nr:PspC domain-containing protein [Microbispora rosea]GGO06824.1 hypothetical protein GCM10010116_13580 [Microbispora rosea subsp. aerata]GIH55035.1 hypothetical protein Mro02_19490 [Microbispora rosea subsp. aerata]GLJ82484.1 hypothetical protein GCM10017588_12090 [Microbispora rosea subsp. aerata]
MTEAPPTPASESAGPPEPEKVLSRSRDGRMITGVCAGLGRFTGMDPVLFRVGFAVLVLASGTGILLYIAAFLLMRQPGGGPGHLEQWTRRLFDAETVLALLAAVFAFGLIINVVSGGINRGTIVVGTLLAIVLLAAHARGVDLLTMAKSMPERATGRRGVTRASSDFAPFAPFASPYAGEPYGRPGTGVPTPETPPRETASPTWQGRGPGQEPAAGDAARGPVASAAAVDETAVHETSAKTPAAKDTGSGDDASHETPSRRTVADDTAIQDPVAADSGKAAGRDTARDAVPDDTVVQDPDAGKNAAPDETLVQDAVAEGAPASAGRPGGDPPTRPFETVARLAAEPAPGPHAPGVSGAAGAGASAGWASAPAGPPIPPPPAQSGYRRLSDLAREAREGVYGRSGTGAHREYAAGGHAFGSGEPFAPHGPYTMREPRHPYASPYAPSPYGPPVPPPPARPAKPKRPKSFVGVLTICLALIVGGIMVTMQRTGSGTVGLPVVGGAVLVTIGAGLLVTAWFGRGAGLIAAGTIVALVLVGSSTVNGIPRKIGSFVWHPVGTVQSDSTYELGIGDGKLDLSDITLKPGARVRFDVSVSLGQVTVIVPANARVEVHGLARLGEVRIDHKVEDGTDVRFSRVLEPETPVEGDAPTIELHLKVGLGDVEVRRAA